MDFDIVTTDKDAKLLIKHLLRQPSLAFDSETDWYEGLQWYKQSMLWNQWSDGKKAWLVDIRKGRANIQLFAPVFTSEKATKIIHNSAFDSACLKREFDLNTFKIWDTRFQEQVVLGAALPRELKKTERERWEAMFSASLKFCLQRRGLPDKFEFEPFFEDKEPTDTQVLYMVRDVEFLHELMVDQGAKIKEMGLEHVSYLENVVAEITYNMMCNGFGIDSRGWIKDTEKEEVVYNECMRKLNAIAPINWNSWQQYCKFFNVHRTDDLEGMEVEYNKKGDPKGKLDLALHLWREARKHFKNVNTYGKSWIEQHVHDGLVRCQYTQMVSTARYSCDSPNLQNIPSETPHRSHMFPGHGADNVFVIADFSGQEMAIMAIASGEQSWLDCLRSGRDIHEMVAADVLGETFIKATDKVKKAQRKQIKILNFSIAYGAGVDSILLRALKQGVVLDHDETKERLSIMRQLYPTLFRWLAVNAAEAKVTWVSYSMPPFNRFRYLAMETEGWRRKNIGMNNPVQATAADMAKLAMYHMYQEIKAGLKAWFIHMLHDELIIECNTKHQKRVSKLLVQAMNTACETILGEPLSNPEVKVQRNWDKRKE